MIRNMRDAMASLTIWLPLAATAQSPYIARVLDFCPAPGQFVNEVPEHESGFTKADMLGMCEEYIAGTANGSMVSLGDFGGYIVFAFDHPVVNRHGYYDFKVNGNAIISDTNRGGGSCEPGIVSVSVDTNGNGLPDDEWYELAGCAHGDSGILRGYSVTYHRPSADKELTPDPDRKFIADTEYIHWTDSEGESGWIPMLSSHTQGYWPGWLSDSETLTLSGTRLAPNGEALNAKGTNYVLMMLDWGYADNQPNAACPGFNLDWAIDAAGNPVVLDHADFIKVHTATRQQCGWLGETSTEVTGAVDLHPDWAYVAQWPEDPEDPHAVNHLGASVRTPGESGSLLVSVSGGALTVVSDRDQTLSLYDMTGAAVGQWNVTAGQNSIALTAIAKGAYILRGSSTSQIVVL